MRTSSAQERAAAAALQAETAVFERRLELDTVELAAVQEEALRLRRQRERKEKDAVLARQSVQYEREKAERQAEEAETRLLLAAVVEQDAALEAEKVSSRQLPDPNDLETLCAVLAAFTAHAWSFGPAGCNILPAGGERVIEAFLASRLPVSAHRTPSSVVMRGHCSWCGS